MNTDMPRNMDSIMTHINEHITYPASKDEIMKACRNMSDVSDMDRKWLDETLPEKKFENAEEVKEALML